MKAKWMIIAVIIIALIIFHNDVMAQCSICTKTAQQLDPKSAKGLNAGILYLMSMPLTVAGVIGFRWWKSNKKQ